MFKIIAGHKYKLTIVIAVLALVLGYILWPVPYHNNSPTTVLSPNQVFKVSAKLIDSHDAQLTFTITPGYFIYKNRLFISTIPESTINMQAVILPHTLSIPDINDPNKMDEVYAGSFVINLPLKTTLSELHVTLQGCDGGSICYPPQKYTFDLAETTSKPDTGLNNPQHELHRLSHQFMQLYHGEISGQSLLGSLNTLELILLFFIAGIAISLTPCMYPLYPIALSTIMGSHDLKRKNIVMLVLAYVHGIALIYVLIGFIAAFSGKLLTTVIQTPAVMIFSGAIWLLLGLAMFDLIEIKLPNRLNHYLHRRSMNLNGGSYTKVFAMGILSSILLGPCVTPPLIAAIGLIVGSQDVLFGGISLYAISLGMGVPILILALLGGRLMPKSGNWMSGVKYLMGSLIIAVSIYLVYPFINLANIWVSIGILFLGVAVIFMLIRQFRGRQAGLPIHQIMPIILVCIGIGFTYYGVKNLTAAPAATKNATVITAKTAKELELAIAQTNKPVLLDFYATWCSVCHEMEQKTFSQKEVQQALQSYTVIKFDLSDNTNEQLKVLSSYGLYGPPALIIISTDKKVTDKMLGFVSSAELIKHLANNK